MPLHKTVPTLYSSCLKTVYKQLSELSYSYDEEKTSLDTIQKINDYLSELLPET